MIIMAIDASTYSTGVAIFNNQKLIYQQCIRATSADLIDRVVFMSIRIQSIAKEYQPSDVIMEDPLPEECGHSQNTYRALMYLQAGVVIKLHEIGLNVKFYVSSHWRKLVGIKTGRGIKRQMLKGASIELVKAKFDLDVNDDIADAINIGVAYWLEYGSAFY